MQARSQDRPWIHLTQEGQVQVASLLSSMIENERTRTNVVKIAELFLELLKERSDFESHAIITSGETINGYGSKTGAQARRNSLNQMVVQLNKKRKAAMPGNRFIFVSFAEPYGICLTYEIVDGSPEGPEVGWSQPLGLKENPSALDLLAGPRPRIKLILNDNVPAGLVNIQNFDLFYSRAVRFVERVICEELNVGDDGKELLKEVFLGCVFIDTVAVNRMFAMFLLTIKQGRGFLVRACDFCKIIGSEGVYSEEVLKIIEGNFYIMNRAFVSAEKDFCVQMHGKANDIDVYFSFI